MRRTVCRPWLMAFGFVAAVAGCESGQPLESGDGISQLEVVPMADGYDSCSHGIDAKPPCHARVKIVNSTGNGAIGAGASTAATRWNAVLQQHPGLPRFDPAGSRTLTIAWGNRDYTGDGAWYCANVDGGLTTIFIGASDEPGNCRNSEGRFSSHATQSDLAGLISHEITHILGIRVHVLENPDPAAPAAHCASALPDIGLTGRAFNSGICQWEIQQILYNYGMRTTAPDETKHFVTGITTSPASLAIEPGDQSAVTITQLVLERANPAVFGESSGGLIFQSPAGATFQWTATNPAAATVSPATGATATVTGIADGDGDVRISVTSAGSYALAAPLIERGHTLPVTVRTIAPDLVAGTLGGLAVANIGEPYVLHINVRNDGDEPVGAAWFGRVFLSADTAVDGADVAVDSFPGPNPLAPGSSVSLQRTFTVPGALGPGAWHWVVQLDAGLSIAEASELNNSAAKAVDVSECTWPDIVRISLGSSAAVTGTGSCTGRTAVITWGTGKGAFDSPNYCTVRELANNPTNTFSIIGCNEGSASLTIYRDAAKTQPEAHMPLTIYRPIKNPL